jgi:D-amino peptidase
VQSIFGIDPIDRGEIRVDGLRFTPKSPRHAVTCGVAHLPETVLVHGLVPTMEAVADAGGCAMRHIGTVSAIVCGSDSRKSGVIARSGHVEEATPMKVLISADMEGVTGVTAPDDVFPGTAAYERFRRLFLRDVNAAVTGAFDGGATEVVVNEAHNYMRNLLIEDLDARAELITGHQKPYIMMEGIDREVDLVFFVGYHAPTGAPGVLSHTFSGKGLSEVRLNDEVCSEGRMNAMLAGSYGVPVGLLTGDRAACEDAARYIPGIRTVAVKEEIDRYAARCLPPARTEQMIREAAAASCRDVATYAPLIGELPFRWTMTFTNPSSAQRAALIPTVERTDARTVVWSSEDYASTFNTFAVVIFVMSSAFEPHGDL